MGAWERETVNTDAPLSKNIQRETVHLHTYSLYIEREDLNRGDAPYSDTPGYDNHFGLPPMYIIY
jgi:hypothetical protein